MNIDHNLQHRIEQLLYTEARLLDERVYEEWLTLLTTDIEYKMPMRVDRSRKHSLRFKGEDELFAFDDDYRSLTTRVKRIRSSSCWTEDPPARARHFINNVQLESTDSANEITAISAFMVSVSRMEGLPCLFTGQRQDRIREENGTLKICKRWIVSDQSVISSNDLTIFF